MKLYKLVGKKIIPEDTDIKFEKSYDVIVAGLGTAGAVCAVTAARHGLRVLGLERLCAMGGTGTLGAIEAYYFGNKGGMYEEFDKKALKLSKVAERKENCRRQRMDIKAYVLEKEAQSAGVQICYDSEITGVFVQGRTVCGALVYMNGIQHAIGAKYVMDATGNAGVCAMITDKFYGGRSYEGKMQPYSNISIRSRGGSLCSQNKDAGYVDPSAPKEVTKAFLKGALQPNCYAKDHTKELGVITNAALIGCREGAKIMSEDDITVEGFLADKKTDKPLFYTWSNLDSHAKDLMFEDKFLREWYAVCGLWGVCVSIGVPIGALAPKGFKGIGVCGRAIGADHVMTSCVRMKRDVQKCGEALGVAAAVAIEDGVDLCDADYDKISSYLRKTGCLDEKNYVPLAHRKKNGEGEVFEWLKDEEQIKEGLASEKPGTAIWSCKRIGTCMADRLAEWIHADDENLCRSSALALGLLGDTRACSVLRKMASEPDMYIPKTSLKYVQVRAVSAIYLLGELGDTQSVDILENVVCKNGAVFDKKDFRADELYAFEGDLRFELVSFAIRSLCQIAKKHNEQKNRIVKIFEQSVFSDGFEAGISLKENTYMVYDFCGKLREYVRREMGLN